MFILEFQRFKSFISHFAITEKSVSLRILFISKFCEQLEKFLNDLKKLKKELKFEKEHDALLPR